MSLPLTRLRCAKKIQAFYNTYIKADRDRESGLPIDPISRDVIPKERQLKLFITINGIVRRIQYFDINHLDSWFASRGQPINPITNLLFTKKQLADIRSFYNRIGLIVPHILESDYVPPVGEDILIDGDEDEGEDGDEEGDEDEDTEQLIPINNLQQINSLLEHLVDICSNPMAIDEIRDILYSNVQNENFNINHVRNIGHPLISTGTALMNAVLNDNKVAVEELLYFNPELNISDSLYGYKAVDLAIICNGDESCHILQMLLFHGARLDIPTIFGHSSELTTDIGKLEVIYNFTDT
jgi:hypothetical protein